MSSCCVTLVILIQLACNLGPDLFLIRLIVTDFIDPYFACSMLGLSVSVSPGYLFAPFYTFLHIFARCCKHVYLSECFL